MLLVVLLLLAPAAHSETCANLGSYLTTLDQLIADEATGAALDAHPAAPRTDTGLEICAAENTCCSAASEAMLREASTEIFHTYSISMAMGEIEEELREMRSAATAEVPRVVEAADGVVAAANSRQYVIEQDIDVDTVGRSRLAHFVSTVYGAQWEPFCLDPLVDTRTLMSERVFSVLNQYKKILSGLLEGINKLPSLKVLAISEMSESCTAALTRAGMFEGMGCKKCGDPTATVKTCYATCTNIARGCLRPMLCHTADWVAWSKRQDVLTEELVVIAEKRSALIDALVEKFELEYVSAVRGNTWNVIDCSIDLDSRSAERITALRAANINLPSVKMDTFADQFSGRLRALPEEACAESSYVSDVQYEADAECWNGTAVGAYLHPAPTFTLEDQKCNPEVEAVQLTCDDRDMLCGSYELPSTEPPKGPTEGAVVGKPGSGTQGLVASVILMAAVVFFY